MADIRIICAEVCEGLRTLPDESVDCVVTSPPYWGLRDYGVEGQIGLEPTLGEFIARLVGVFDEVRRVLKPSGTCWVNMGDAYASGGGSGLQGKRGQRFGRRHTQEPLLRVRPAKVGLKPKDLMMQPARLAIAMQESGWYLRSKIVWHKPNPMPESASDRPTQAHEDIFLFTKSRRYFYDAEASSERGTGRDGGGISGWAAEGLHEAREFSTSAAGKSHADLRRAQRSGRFQKGDANRDPSARADAPAPGYVHIGKRNMRNVWTIATEPCPEAHFATFPTELPRRCIVAGCPAGGVVLDIFGGSGTTAIVAEELGRSAILIEINPGYVEIAKRRIARARLKRRRASMADVAAAGIEPTPLEALINSTRDA